MRQEQRQFTRIPINFNGTLSAQQNTWPVTILDVSIQGFKVQVPQAALGHAHSQFTLTLKPNDESPAIACAVLLTYTADAPNHQNSTTIDTGMKIVNTDVNSMADLRRLLLLNSGKQTLEQQELTALLDHIFASA